MRLQIPRSDVPGGASEYETLRTNQREDKMKSTITKTFFYHIYPLGLCGCPHQNTFSCPAGQCFEKLSTDLPRIKSLGVNALYIGPVFESTSHGYDTVDYYHIDRRLGNNESFRQFCEKCHEAGIKIVLDAVFNHTGRDFFAFKDIQKNGVSSPYRNWYANLSFDRKSCYGDNFYYDGWAGCMNLVKLNVDNSEVQDHLFGAVRFWKKQFKIDGLRLDAADVLSPAFLDALGGFCRSIDEDFWLLGEVVHGDYNNWAKHGRIDSVTNYELYKGLWSSFNSRNFFEVAYSLNRQFGSGGIYTYAPLYTFADNHDVDRIASTLTHDAHLFPLYGLLFTVPGIPSVYYGSEYALKGKRTHCSDSQLRPSLPPFAESFPDFAKPSADSGALFLAIQTFAKIRAESPALQHGSYREVFVSHEQLAFLRETEGERVLVAVNAGNTEKTISPGRLPGSWTDVLNGGTYENLNQVTIPRSWLRILKQN